jgi:hypothetical protein
MEVILSSIKNHKIELINEPHVVAVVGEEYYFKPEVKSIDDCKSTHNLNYSLVIKPTWLSVDPLSGILSGQPSQANVGDNLYSYKVVDGCGGFIIKDVRLKVHKE